MTVKTFSW